MEKLYTLLQQDFDEMVAIRRYLHENPELSFEEVETAKYIADFHRLLGNEVQTNVGGNGVVAKLHGAKPGKTVALRADFDALAIYEQNDVPYQSKNAGVMHACGHDGHTATLLVLAKVLVAMKEEIAGTIVFIHQHAEEIVPGGAKAMIEAGCLDGVDVIFGTHLWSLIPYGVIELKEGALMAAADRVEIRIKGQGGHGSEPHLTKDAIVIAAQFITNAQQIVARTVSPIQPAVISFGHIEAINPFNVIADEVIIQGTVRTFDDTTREQIAEDIEKTLQAACLLSGADYDYTYHYGYPAVVNHAQETQYITAIAEKIPQVEAVKVCQPFLCGEDFAYYLEQVPGAFFFTGAKNPDWQIAYPHHHPKFDIDERAMLIAAATLGQAALQFNK